MPLPSVAVSRRAQLSFVLVALVSAVGCGVPTEPRWDRADDVDVPTSPLAFETAAPTTHVIEAAPVTAATTIQARVLPATETVVVAPADGRIGRILTSTGSELAAGEPVIEWLQGSGEATEADVLRVEILERQILLAEIEGRADDALAATTELEVLRAEAAAENVLVRAPVDGVLGQFLAQRSKHYEAGDPLFTVGDPAALRVDIEVNGEDFADVVEGTELRVIDAQNRFADPTPAVVISVDVVEPASEAPVGTSAVRIASAVLDDGTTLTVGERVLVDVDRSSGATSRRVHADAVLDDGRGPFLIVVDDAGWRRVDISIGVASGDYLEVLADIDVGTVVVVP